MDFRLGRGDDGGLKFVNFTLGALYQNNLGR